MNNMEKAKFPMPTMAITQGYDMGTHRGTYALDMAGEDGGIDWVLAPFTCKVKHVESNRGYGNWYWVESVEPVLCANGEVTKLVAMFGHDNKMRHKVGDIIKQGQPLCAEGTSGHATGNHCHFELGKGSYVGTWHRNSYGVYMLYNEVKPNEYLCVPDNYKIKKTGGYNWKKESQVKTGTTSSGQKLYLPKTATSWRIYPVTKRPVAGNECGRLNPSKFGGLTYDIKGWTNPNVALIDTRDFGRVQIYVAPSTGAVVK
jgi:murein DD-endopeptidase MepM/ murein hydrolase activator NlpD